MMPNIIWAVSFFQGANEFLEVDVRDRLGF